MEDVAQVQDARGDAENGGEVAEHPAGPDEEEAVPAHQVEDAERERAAGAEDEAHEGDDDEEPHRVVEGVHCQGSLLAFLHAITILTFIRLQGSKKIY